MSNKDDEEDQNQGRAAAENGSDGDVDAAVLDLASRGGGVMFDRQTGSLGFVMVPPGVSLSSSRGGQQQQRTTTRSAADERPQNLLLTPLERDPECLGGWTPSSVDGGGGCKIPSELFYATLPRPARLPPVNLTNKTFKNAKAKKLYRQLYDETISMKWMELFPNSNRRRINELWIELPSTNDSNSHDTKNCHELRFSVFLNPNEDDWQGQRKSLMYLKLQVTGRPSLTSLGYHNPPMAFAFDDEPLEHLFPAQHQRDKIATRLLHRFYRQAAIHLSPELQWAVSKTLETRYTQRYRNGKWIELVDVCMIHADVAFCCNDPHPDLARCLVSVGETLEGQGNVPAAARVYDDVTAGLESGSLSNESNCTLLISNKYAGLAYKRAGDYVAAERAYLAALRAEDPFDSWRHLNEPFVRSLLANLLLLYETILVDNYLEHHGRLTPQQQEQRNSWDASYREFMETSPVLLKALLGLLLVARFNPPENVAHIFHREAQDGKNCLKSDYTQTPQAAMTALQAAINCPSAQSYRVRVLSYFSSNHPTIGFDMACLDASTTVTRTGQGTQSSKQQNRTKRYVQTARQVFRESNAENHPTQFLAPCSNPACPSGGRHRVESLKSCPCRQVKYCSKSCQVTHWKQVHKRECATRKQKNG